MQEDNEIIGTCFHLNCVCKFSMYSEVIQFLSLVLFIREEGIVTN